MLKLLPHQGKLRAKFYFADNAS